MVRFIDDDEVDLGNLAARKGLRAPTFGRVVDAMPVERRQALATVWRLMARGTFRAELSEPISFDTPFLS